MSLVIEIPEPLATQLSERAQARGLTPSELVLDAVSRQLVPFANLDKIMAPTYKRMKELGITEDEAVEDFEREKHAMRAEQAAKAELLARLDQSFAPVRARIAELGETEDDVVEYLEQIKHELRAEEQAELQAASK